MARVEAAIVQSPFRGTRQALVHGGLEDVLDARGVVAAHAFDEVVGGDEGAHGVADGRRVARFRDLEAQDAAVLLELHGKDLVRGDGQPEG